MFILDLETDRLLQIVIQNASLNEIKLSSSKFEFNWTKLFKQSNTQTYSLKLDEENCEIIGLLHLINNQGMLIMNLVEVNQTNIGRKKRYDFIAGCLIAFACQKSFELDSDYKGFLTFTAKSQLIELYKTKYYAKQVNGQRMYIEPEFGVKLINKYLNRKK